MGNSELSFFVNMKLWLFGSSNACKKQDRQNNTEESHWYNRTIEQKKKMNLIETQIKKEHN